MSTANSAIADHPKRDVVPSTLRRRRRSACNEWATPHAWIEIVAYERWEARGRSHGGDFDDWLEAESEIAEALDAISSSATTSWDELQCTPLFRLSPAEGLLRLRRLIRIFPASREESSPASTAISDQRGGAAKDTPHVGKEVDMSLDPKPPVELSLDEIKRRAESNRNPLDEISAHERERYQGRQVAVGNVGRFRGKVIGYGATRLEAEKMAVAQGCRHYTCGLLSDDPVDLLQRPSK